MKEVDRILNQMDKVLKETDSDKVNVLYSQLTDIVPDSYNVYKGWFEYIILHYEDYISADPDIEQVFVRAIDKCRKAQKCCGSNNLSDLLLYEYKLIDILTEYDSAYFNHYSGDYQLALLGQAISLNPGNKEAYYKRSSIYFAIGKQAEALKDVDMVLSLSTNEKNMNPIMRCNMAMKLELSGNVQKAITEYEDILKHSKGRVIVQKLVCTSLVRLYKKLRDKGKTEYYEKLLYDLE